MARSANLVPRYDASRQKGWWISIPPRLSNTGKRQRRFFATKRDALAEVQRLKVRQENHGIAAKLLSPANEQQAANAIRLLEEAGIEVQLSEVVGDYLHRWRQRNASVTLQVAWRKYIDHLVENGCSEVHRKNHERTLKSFSNLHERLLTDLTANEINGVIEGGSKSYYNAQLRELRSVLNFGIGKKWLAVNPVQEVGFKRCKLGEVEIYSPEQIQVLMEGAASHHWELMPAMALMTFAGIRPDCDDGEITRVTWNSIILDDQHKRIELPGSVTKTGKRRTIIMRPPLVSWIEWYIKRGGVTEGTVCPIKNGVLRKKIGQIFSEAKVKRIQDGFRHSFGSYLAKSEGLDKAEQELGHQGGRELLNRHYRTDVRDADARKFWDLTATNVN